LELIPLSKDLKFDVRNNVNEFLTQRWLWEQLEPASWVLFFQLDSMLCGNSDLKPEDFFIYDDVGAPWPQVGGKSFGANGGLSLRRRERILEVLDKWDWDNHTPEDVWYWLHMQELGSPLPSGDIAKTFSVEQIWYDKPLGYHQARIKGQSKFGELDKWCPEYKLTTERTFNS